ncbi:two-component system sensor histidine kinase CreC, partial [Klebsiella pneumoniae]|nr:two-component system sensor histidine kinase CreC [Klebsiella pneumoniae]
EIKQQPVSIDALYQRLMEERNIALAAKAITLRWRESGMLVNGDVDLLSQALGNLLDNAIYFTPQGCEIALSAEKRN